MTTSYCRCAVPIRVLYTGDMHDACMHGYRHTVPHGAYTFCYNVASDYLNLIVSFIQEL